MPAPPSDLSEFRLMRALRAGQPGAFPSLWNGIAGDAWSVFRALVDSEGEALGWMNSFRLDLADAAPSFDPAAALGPQVGRELLAHADRAFGLPGEMPVGPLSPDERGVRALPTRVRLRYLVDLFFDHTVDDPEVRRAYALLEPSLDTDARMLVHAALLRRPPAAALLLPPGAEPPRRAWAPVVGWSLVALTAVAILWTLWPRAWDAAAEHERAYDAAHDLVLESEPDLLSLSLTRRGVPGVLADVPDLEGWGLQLLGARIGEGAVVLLYRGGDGEWTLQHVDGGRLPESEPVDRRGDVRAWRDGASTIVGWKETSGSTWLLVAELDPTRVLDVGAALREHRRRPIPLPDSIFDGLVNPE